MKYITVFFFRTIILLTMLLSIFSTSAPVMAQSTGPVIHITQVDNSTFPRVTVYFSAVNEAGEPIGIDPRQIELTENGQVMDTSEVSSIGEVGELTTMLVMDVSGSMLLSGKLAGAKKAAVTYINQMRAGDQAGLYTFNTVVKYVQPVTSDRAALIAAIEGLNAYDDTAMYDAISQASNSLKDFPGRKAIIVLTDGMDNISKNSPEAVIKGIAPNGLSISTIGLGDPNKTGINSGLDEEGLKKLSEKAGGIYSYANNPESLKNLYQGYSRNLQNEFRLMYTSPSSLRDGNNRTLNINIVQSGNTLSSTTASYNPGGVLPEAGRKSSWLIFGILLTALLILLLVPMIYQKVRLAAPAPDAANKVKKTVIKLK